jgi:hypothetical protein
MKLRAHLVLLILAVLIPMVTFSTVVMVLLGRRQHAAAERGAIQTARALTNALDENVRSTITALQALAAAEPLDSGDLRAFDLTARRVLRPGRTGTT